MRYKSRGLHIEIFTLVPYVEGGQKERKWYLGVKRRELQHIYDALFY